jgi:parvulin-like peptidyl-prolyl isomerase
MSLMTKMRDNMAGIFAVFAVMFILYIIFDWGMDLLSRRSRQQGDVVGRVNGYAIHSRELSDIIKNLSESQKQQAGRDVDEESSRQLRDQAWSMLVNQIIIDGEVRKLGLSVTDQELIDWVRGDEPPEFLKRQFTDSAGIFNRAAYEAALDDPQNSAVWVQVEAALRKQRLQEKFQSALQATVRVSEGEIRDRFIDENLHLKAEYVLFDAVSMVKDSDVVVTDDDIKKYYTENQEEFRRKATRRLKYVLFPEVPSHDDTTGVIRDLEEYAREARSGSDFLQLAKTYSEIAPSEAFFKRGELSAVRDSAVFSSKLGQIIGPLEDTDGYHLLKILEERKGKEEVIRASHILLRVPSSKDSVEVWKKARELTRQARRGEDFAELATEHSSDGSASKGGDLGWFAKGRMVKPFEDAVFRAKVGEIVGPVRSQFGLHIIKVTGRSSREVKIADIFLSVKPSSQTRAAIHSRADDLSYLASQGDFDKEASLSKYSVLETPPFPKGTVIPGIGFSEEILRFAFDKKLGDVSEPLKTSAGYGVFKISEAKEEGISPLSEVRETIRPKVLLKKKITKVGEDAKQIRSKLQPTDSLGVVSKFDLTLKVVETGDFTPSRWLPNLGRDDEFIGKALSLKAGEISEAFAGRRGYFIVKLLDRTDPDSTEYEAKKTAIRDRLLQEKRNRYLGEWMNALKEKADIVDNRDLFYR